MNTLTEFETVKHDAFKCPECDGRGTVNYKPQVVLVCLGQCPTPERVILIDCPVCGGHGHTDLATLLWAGFGDKEYLLQWYLQKKRRG